jgi:hypothetical protein
LTISLKKKAAFHHTSRDSGANGISVCRISSGKISMSGMRCQFSECIDLTSGIQELAVMVYLLLIQALRYTAQPLKVHQPSL